MKIIIELFLNALPVILAAIFHMVVVKKQWFNSLAFPLDHYKTYKNKRIFGDNKTYRGLVIMIAASVFFSFLYYKCIYNCTSLQPYNLLDTSKYSFIFYGFLYGIGYIIGELPNSFYKRQIGIVPGKSHAVFTRIIDQIDSVFTVMLLLVLFSFFTWFHFIFGVVFYGLIHIIINYLLFLIGLRKEPF